MLNTVLFSFLISASSMPLSAIAKARNSSGRACGVFELNSYGQGCSPMTIRAGQCPTVGLTIWPRLNSTNILIHTSIPSEVANQIVHLKCICMDYRMIYETFGSVTLVHREPTSSPYACRR